MADLVSSLRAEIASLERQIATWKTLHDHQGTPMLAVMPDGDSFRVAMTWDEDWALPEFSVLLATVIKHVANNATLDEGELLLAIDHALSHMENETVNGGRVM